MSMAVIVNGSLCGFVVNADGVLAVEVRLLDDPAVSCAAGLDFIEFIRLPDEFEVGRSKKGVFLWCEHHGFRWRLLGASPYPASGSQTMAGCSAGVIRMQLSS